jgi:PAS domain S-box-containing protein
MFETVTGYSRSEVEGTLSWRDLVHPEDRERMEEYHRLRRVDPELVPANYGYVSSPPSGRLDGVSDRGHLADDSRTLLSSWILRNLRRRSRPWGGRELYRG